jgi:RecA-family ATPase
VSHDWRDDTEVAAARAANRAARKGNDEDTPGNGRTADWRELELVRFAHVKPRLDGRPLVKGLLEREQTSLVFGESGCGKTFFALDQDLHIAAGLDWFGRRVEQGSVVYVAAEAGRWIFNRIAAWRDAHKLDKKDIPFVVLPQAIDLSHPAAGDLQRLIDAIRGAGLGDNLAKVEIDTVSRVLSGGNENAPNDMGMFVSSLDRLRDELHCHVGGVHHSGKDQARGSRGHSLLHCAVDTEVQVIRDPANRSRPRS